MSQFARSFWVPGIVYEIRATEPSRESCVLVGWLTPGMARTSFENALIASCVAGWSAWVTTTWSSSVEPCGHFAFISLIALTESTESGNAVRSVTPSWKWRNGTASRRRNPADATNVMTGRRIAPLTIRPHSPVPSGRWRPK